MIRARSAEDSVRAFAAFAARFTDGGMVPSATSMAASVRWRRSASGESSLIGAVPVAPWQGRQCRAMSAAIPPLVPR